MNAHIIAIRNHPEYTERGIDYFSSKWGIPRREYEISIQDCLHTAAPLPRWYLMLDNTDRIIGSFGLIQNDFVDRTDLFPYLCALYIEEDRRGEALGSRLLQHGRQEAASLGFAKVYLCTDHSGYYEKYGWTHIGTGHHPGGDTSRIYEATAIPQASDLEKAAADNVRLERMQSFFAARVEGYDDHMLNRVEGCAEAYSRIARLIPSGVSRLLDLGCGTGLELDEIFRTRPELAALAITGIDLTSAMLDKLRTKHPDKNLTLIQASYFDYDFGQIPFDVVLSVQTMHHFSHQEKLDLYRKIYQALRSGGIYIECDYMVLDQAEEDHLYGENARIRQSQGIPDGEFYHFDTPCTIENQIRLLRQAGFDQAAQNWRVGNTTILVASKSKSELAWVK